MKTIDEALKDSLEMSYCDVAADVVKMKSADGFAADVAESGDCNRYIQGLMFSYFMNPTVGYAEILMAFGLSSFAAGVRVGIEMERQ